MRWVFFVIALSGLSCRSYINEMKQAYNKRQEILQVFKNVSVFRDQRNNYIFLHTYNNSKQNQYIFSANQNEYSFERDSILFSPDGILNIVSEGDPSYKKQLNERIKFYLKKMDSLNISDVSSDFISQGITLKIYMKSKAILLYVVDPKNVINQEWVNYLKSMKKFDDNWYYSGQDK
ncbi:MAG TPA: hypothetical protein VFN30_04835 [Chitinophagaceae bacterium]|nr:hypothetical protein [Chitinophagaceae bacterium]